MNQIQPSLPGLNAIANWKPGSQLPGYCQTLPPGENVQTPPEAQQRLPTCSEICLKKESSLPAKRSCLNPMFGRLFTHAKNLLFQDGGSTALWFTRRSVKRSRMIYFDHNATTPMLPEARQAWLEAAERFIGNPSSPHRIGARADAALTEARQRLAIKLDCDPLDIVWTSGATEANNMALHHFASDECVQAWVSAIEHPCVLEAARHYFPNRLRLMPVTRAGTTNLDWLSEHLAETRPGFVAMMAANNETGVLQPWREILAMCRQYEVPFFCDATQWIGKSTCHGLGECDFVSGSAHKFGGPKGVGFLKCPSKGRVYPLLHGGPQEEGRRSGTENVAGVLSMLAALEARERSIAQGETEKRSVWRHCFERRLGHDLAGCEIVGSSQERLWNTVSALMPETDCQQRWVVKLDKIGFAVSTGSACASGREESSHVLAAMSYSPREASRVLRFSSGWETTEDDWRALAEALIKVSCGLSVEMTRRNS
ncbi:MAG: cysteine desulfurase [Verrucomicrobia bacterium]|nr:cysteine desulfurase [Verrucomicrobiota bacterium]